MGKIKALIGGIWGRAKSIFGKIFGSGGSSGGATTLPPVTGSNANAGYGDAPAAGGTIQEQSVSSSTASPLEAAATIDIRSEIIQRVHADVSRAFATSSTPAGEKWAPLKWRKGQALVLTGLLYARTMAAVMNPRIVRNAYVFETSDPPYGKFHQHGTRRIPRRRFFGMSASTITYIATKLKNTAATFLVGGR